MKVLGGVKVIAISACCAVLILCAGVSSADSSATYDFEIFTSNGTYGAGGVDNHLTDFKVYVYNGEGTAKFKFYNYSDPISEAAITDVYFDDGTLLAISGIENSSGYTSFTNPAAPENLPGGGGIGFTVTDSFSADSTSPGIIINAVNPDSTGIDEWVTIVFDLQDIWDEGLGDFRMGTIDDVISEINDQTLRIGIHIQNFPGGSSESAVNVPEPATLCLLGLGSMMMLRKKRRA